MVEAIRTQAQPKPPRHAGSGNIGALRLELRDIVKIYPGVRANDGVCLQVAPGEIHAVLGENGAGKSTLMKIIYGVTRPDAGSVLWNGEQVSIESPEQARKLGIAMVFQHFSLFETLTVVENVWLGLPEPSKARVAEQIREQGARYGLALDPDRPVHTLSVGEKQRVEIVRALLTKPQLLILDEPTSVLTPQAVDELFATLRKLAQAGCSILYISHKLEEIRALCHRCTVLRAGKVVGDVADPAGETAASLSRRMIGAEPPPLEHKPWQPGAAVLEVRGLSLPKLHDFGVDLHDVSLEVREGEVLGIAGVSGNGQSELLAALSGEDRRAAPSSIRLLERDVSQCSPEQRRKSGLHFVPEERLGRATVPAHSLADNALLTRRSALPRGLLLRRSPLERLAQGLIDRFGIKARGPSTPAQSLSGGNLQKYVVGRELDAAPKLLIVSQPTWGVDVGAAAQIRRSLLELRDHGAALLVVSEELDELFELSDTLVVMAEGRVSPKILRRDASFGLIGQWMSGLWSRDAPAHASSQNPPEDLAHAGA